MLSPDLGGDDDDWARLRECYPASGGAGTPKSEGAAADASSEDSPDQPFKFKFGDLAINPVTSSGPENSTVSILADCDYMYGQTTKTMHQLGADTHTLIFMHTHALNFIHRRNKTVNIYSLPGGGQSTLTVKYGAVVEANRTF